MRDISKPVVRPEDFDFRGERRIGRFHISSEFVNSDLAPLVLGKMAFVPIRVEVLFHKGVFEYTGVSFLFGKVLIGVKIPFYRITIKEVGEDIEVLVECIKE